MDFVKKLLCLVVVIDMSLAGPTISQTCPDGDSPVEDEMGVDINCGRLGTKGECPENSFCYISKDDTFTFCCPGVAPTCPNNLVWNVCAPPESCDKTCKHRNPCPLSKAGCQERCVCPNHAPYLQTDVHGVDRCVSEDQCCPDGLVYDFCGSACPPSCDDVEGELIFCPAVCVIGCQCPKGLIKIEDKSGVKCITKDECPIKCSGGQEFQTCGSRCTPTCDNPNPICTKECVARCQCPREAPLWDSEEQECITSKQCHPCQQPLKIGPCRAAIPRYYFNSDTQMCELFYWGGCQPNGNNFGNMFECLRTCWKGCFPVSPCLYDHCAEGPHVDSNGCIKECECECPCKNKRCGAKEMCVLQDVVCVTSPCPPLPVCVPKDSCKHGKPTRACFSDSQCKDYQTCNIIDKDGSGVCCDKAPNPCKYGDRGRRCSQKGIACPFGNECQLDPGSTAGWCCATSHCSLPPDSGCGKQKKMKWYYDPEFQICRKFRYGGGGGNSNKFNTYKKCMKECHIKCSPVVCTLYCQYGFKKDKDGCEICECNHPCDGVECKPGQAPVVVTLPCFVPPCPEICECKDICSLPAEVGLCKAIKPRWYHNSQNDLCEPFNWGGCGGNDNKYLTKEECEDACGKNPCKIMYPEKECKVRCPYGYMRDEDNCPMCRCHDPCRRLVCQEDEVCQVEPVLCKKGPCLPIGVCVWKKCEIGQPLTDNNGIELFCGRGPTRVDCPKGSQCVIDPVDRFAVCCADDICSLPPDSGPCVRYRDRYYFNPLTKTCDIFPYGGCRGNKNKFRSMRACLRHCNPCKKLVCDVECEFGYMKDENGCDTCDCAFDPCSLILCLEGHICVKGECIKVDPCGGPILCDTYCPGGYASDSEGCPTCECTNPCAVRLCLAGLTCVILSAEKCDSFPCIEQTACILNECKVGQPYLVNGSPYECTPGDDKCPPGYLCVNTDPPTCCPDGPCNLPPDSGACSVDTFTTRWFYDRNTRQCKAFTYSGCGGNENNYLTEAECRSQCSCPPVKCSGPCRFGFAHDRNGCQTCECFVPCATIDCKDPFVCLEFSNCDPADEDCFPLFVGKCVEPCPAPKIWNPCEPTGCCREVCGPFQPLCPCLKKCNSQCVCPEDRPIAVGDGCYTQDDCEAAQQCEAPLVYSNCVTCPVTCDNPLVICLAICTPGCSCPKETPILHDGKCISADQCPKACKYGQPLLDLSGTGKPQYCGLTDKDCPPGYECVQDNDENMICCPKPDQELCMLPQSVGPCDGFFPSWFYNYMSNECEYFVFGGCEGNANRFPSKEECMETCQPRCKLPIDEGSGEQGSLASMRWAYNVEIGACEQFVYSGYQGNTNNFKSQAVCEQHCVHDCHLEPDPGPCEALYKRWFYNPDIDECEPFTYGGCEGNNNNFNDEMSCTMTCKETPCDPVLCDLFCMYGFKTDKDGCPYCDCNEGPCEGVKCPGGQTCVPDPKECITFPCDQYRCVDECTGGQVWMPCPGPAGCDPICGPFLPDCAPPPPWCVPRCKCPPDAPIFNNGKCITRPECPQFCQSPPDSGLCEAAIKAWYYDPVRGKCERFIYGGCDGNLNNYDSLNMCEMSCGSHFCQLPYDAGTGEDTVEVYYYDSRSGECMAAKYSGAGGNMNRFKTEADCLYVCRPCPVFTCQIQCENGFMRDERGCLICKCNDDPCMDVECAVGQKCIDGKCVCPNNLEYSMCCSACPRTCDSDPFIACIDLCVEGCCCPQGMVLNDLGICVTEDQCPPGPCLPIKYDLVCPWGYLRDENMCDIYECFDPCKVAGCKPDEECLIAVVDCYPDPCYPPAFAECLPGCPQVLCTETCDYKPVLDENGCPTCECIDPCEGKICPVTEQKCNPKTGDCECPGNQIHMSCGSSCTPTCERPRIPCTLQCVNRCECPITTVLSADGVTCVDPNTCPPPGDISQHAKHFS